MKMRTLSRRRALGALSCLVPLGGCNLIAPAPAPQLYRLVPQIGDMSSGARASSQLVVSKPVAPESLDTERIALTRNRRTLDYFAAAAWTDRAPLMLQGLMIAAFEESGLIAAVARESSDINADYRLETELRDFQAGYTGAGEPLPNIVVSMAVQLVRLTDHRVVGHLRAAKEVPAARNDLGSIVEAFDTAAGAVIDQIILWTLRSMSHGR